MSVANDHNYGYVDRFLIEKKCLGLNAQPLPFVGAPCSCIIWKNRLAT